MRFLAVKKESFISIIGYKIIFVMFFSLAGSFTPEWSLKVFILSMMLILFGIILSAIWYKRTPEPRKVDLLTSFVMFFLTGFFLIVPILRLTIDTAAFWIYLLSYLLFVIYFLFRTFPITPNLRGKLKFLPVLVLILFISGFFLRNDGGTIISKVYSQYEAAVIFGTLMSIGGYLFTLTSFTFIKIAVDSR
ncbi:hypothetical protein V7654_02605 [Bacillus sp. JJ1609]|uniref:hypothetical protein n=1 Tax=Bacillus sp. JJ1609 TaxID=3122977 RepID=UPI002FFDA093